MVDHEVRRDQRVDPRRIAAQVRHRVAHHGQVDDGRDAGEVLEDHPRRHERDLGLGGRTGAPSREGLDILAADDPAAGVAEDVFEQDPQRHGRAI